MWEKDGARWLGRWPEDVRGANGMDALENGAVIASGQGALR